MIKPNIDEIRMLTGKHCDNIQDIGDAAKAIHADGVEIVAVSLGADGSLAVVTKESFRARVPKDRCSKHSRMRRFHDRRFCTWFERRDSVGRDIEESKRDLSGSSNERRNRIFRNGRYGKTLSIEIGD